MADEEEIDDQTRGVKNPKIIDLISHDQKTDMVTITMIEDRPWGTSPRQVEELEEKFNNYLDYVLDGWLAQQYPQYEGKKVTLRIDVYEQPIGALATLFEALEACAKRYNLGFEVLATQKH